MNQHNPKIHKKEPVELIKIDEVESLLDLIRNPQKIIAALSGVLSSDRGTLVGSVGKILQAFIKHEGIKQFGKELGEFTKKGLLKENPVENTINKSSLYELLKFVDEETPDEDRMRAMKSIFFKSIEKDATEESSKTAYQLMLICRQLSGAEVLILKAVFDLLEGRGYDGSPGILHSDSNRITWLQNIANQIGHGIPSLVEVHEKHLEDLKLISPRRIKPSMITGDPETIFTATQKYRLTPLGYKLCQFITAYS